MPVADKEILDVGAQIGELLGIGSLGAVIVALIVREMVSWWRGRNLKDEGAGAHSHLIKTLQEEAAKYRQILDEEKREWQALRDKMEKECRDLQNQNFLLLSQNKMLLVQLRLMGATEEQLAMFKDFQ